MEIFISRQNQTHGPYPRDIVEEWINQGKLSAFDLACTADSAWTPLGQLLWPERHENHPVISRGGIWWLVVAGVAFIAIGTVVVSLSSNQRPSTPLSSRASPTPSVCDPSKQPERQNAIAELTQRRVISKIEKPGSLPRVYVGSAFYALNFDQKRVIMELIYCYHFTGDDGIVRIFEPMNGKEIGKYSATFGLEMQ